MFCQQKNALCLVTISVIGNIRLLLSPMCFVKLQVHYDDTCHQIEPGHLVVNPSDAACFAAQVRASRRKTHSSSKCVEAAKFSQIMPRLAQVGLFIRHTAISRDKRGYFYSLHDSEYINWFI